jgi:dTDP-glucose 4,6-dehydratase
VVSFAAESHVDRSILGASAFIETNVVGTQRLLEAASRHRIERFVRCRPTRSTDPSTRLVAENHLLEPNSPYAASRRRPIVAARTPAHDLDVVITRCSNNYGPYQFPEKVIPLFITNLLDGGRVPLYGDGLNVREWLHVDDHCRAIALVLDKGRAGEIYNIGGGTELTNQELTNRLLQACSAGRDSVEMVEDRKAQDRRYSVDATKIAEGSGTGRRSSSSRSSGYRLLVPPQPSMVGATEAGAVVRRMAGPDGIRQDSRLPKRPDGCHFRPAVFTVPDPRLRALPCWRSFA